MEKLFEKIVLVLIGVLIGTAFMRVYNDDTCYNENEVLKENIQLRKALNCANGMLEFHAIYADASLDDFEDGLFETDNVEQNFINMYRKDVYTLDSLRSVIR